MTDEHFARATGAVLKEMEEGEKEAARNPAQELHVASGKVLHDVNQEIVNPADYGALQASAKPCSIPNKFLLGAAGFEPA